MTWSYIQTDRCGIMTCIFYSLEWWWRAKDLKEALTGVCEWNRMVWLSKWKLLSMQYFPVVLFIMLYKVVLTFESVDETVWCDHSNESYWSVLSCGTVNYAVQGGSNLWVCGWNPMVWPLKWKLLSSYFFVVLFIMLYKLVLNFESVDEILWCYHSIEGYWAVIFLWYFLLCCTKWF